MPGVDGASLLGILGAGGGGGKAEDDCGGCVRGASIEGIVIVALFFKLWILSLYTSFNSSTSRSPSLI